MSGLETMEERRKKALQKFANKALKNTQFEHWFPPNTNRTGRHGKTYEEIFALPQSSLYNETPLK